MVVTERVTPCSSSGQARGTVFVARDGSAATFISDTSISDTTGWGEADEFSLSGLLIFRNGVRYRIDFGRVSWIRDRNGNQVNFSYDAYQDLTQIVDSLNRTITVTHTQNYDQIAFQGAGGANRTIQINFGTTSAALDPGCGCQVQSYYDLFGTYGGSSSLANLGVVTSIALPDNRTYSFLYNNYSEPTQITLPTGGKIRYTHGAGNPAAGSGGVIDNTGNPYVYRRVLSRDVYPDGMNLEQRAAFTPAYSSGSFCRIGLRR